MKLTSNLHDLRTARGMNRAAVQRATGIHLFSIGQLDTNRASRVPLQSIARLCRAFGVGVAPAHPVYPGSDSQDAPTGAPAEWLWEWRVRHDGELTLEWALAPILDRRGMSISQLYFLTHEAQSALRRMSAGNYLQVGLESLETLCEKLGIGIAPAAPGIEWDGVSWFFSWTDERQMERATTKDRSDDPIPGQPAKVCRCKLCLTINPAGVEKRIDAFPRSARYKGGRGSVCNKGRAHDERLRRERKRAEAQAKAAAQAADPGSPEPGAVSPRSE